MKYPIDAKPFIKALALEYGPIDKFHEEAYGEVIELVNRCYEDGLQGGGGYPLDLDAERRKFAEAAGKDLEHVKDNPLIPPLIAWCNMAYEQGRREDIEHG